MQFEVAVAQVVAEGKKAEKFDINNLLNLIHTKVSAGIAVDMIAFIEMLWSKTENIAGHVVAVGKIILSKLYDFIVANPNLALGVAVGAALGALSIALPYIGPYVAPLMISAGAIVGGIVGHQLDMIAEGRDLRGSIEPTLASAIDIAKVFFKLLVEIFLSVSSYLKEIRSPLIS